MAADGPQGDRFPLVTIISRLVKWLAIAAACFALIPLFVVGAYMWMKADWAMGKEASMKAGDKVLAAIEEF